MTKEIVLIDDSESELCLLKTAYKDCGFSYTLVPFTDARLAYDYIATHTEQLFIVICDINMPCMDGNELLHKINQNHELKMHAVPFLFLSNSAMQTDIERAYTLAAQGYFQKPDSVDQMTDLFIRVIKYWEAARIPYATEND